MSKGDWYYWCERCVKLLGCEPPGTTVLKWCKECTLKTAEELLLAIKEGREVK